MKFSTIIWILLGIALILFGIFDKKLSKKSRTIFWGLWLGIIFGPMIIPGQFLGTWNSISKFNHKHISKILLLPSQPEWQVNLVSSIRIISSQNQVDSLIHLLKNTEVYSPGHPSRIWEVQMLIISTDNDTLKIEINKTSNNGTVIYTATNDWRKDYLGDYLEKIVDFKIPTYGDSSKNRFR